MTQILQQKISFIRGQTPKGIVCIFFILCAFWLGQSPGSPARASGFAGPLLSPSQRLFLPLISKGDYATSVQFSSSNYSAREDGGTAVLTVTLSASSPISITVRYAASGGTASAAEDYSLLGNEVVAFAPGKTQQAFQIPIVNDPLGEGDEILKITLFSPTQARLGFPKTTNLIIEDDDWRSPFSLQIAALHQITSTAVTMGDRVIQPMRTEEFDAAFPTLLEALTESGAGWTRVYISWAELQPSAPQVGSLPQFNQTRLKWYDTKLSAIRSVGVQVIGTVSASPSWAAQTLCSPIYPDRLSDYAQFLTDLVNRYKAPPYSIQYWEVVNEPDGTWSYLGNGGLGCWGNNGAAYAQALGVAYTAIKNADPHATVLMGGIAHDWFIEYGGPFYRYFPDDVMQANGGDSLDIFAFHYFPDFHAEWDRWDANSSDRRNHYLPAPTCGNLFDGQGAAYEPWGIDLIAKTTHLRSRLSACYNLQKPIWVTELAEHGYAGDNDSLQQQARYVIQGHLRGLAAGVQNITWYALTTPNDSYQQGLLYDDYSPKPAFYAYKTLTTELMGYNYASMLTESDVEGYVFQSATLGQKTAAWGSGALTFAPANELRLVDYQGNITLIADGGVGDVDGTQNNAIVLQMSADPVFAQVLR